MTSTLTDSLLRLTLHDFGDLSVTAFEFPMPELSATFTVSFWFRALSLQTRQVLVSVGNRESVQSGWSLYLSDNDLHLRANFDGRRTVQERIPISAVDQWHHVAAIIDPINQTLRGYLNGARAGWQAGPLHEQLAPGAAVEDQRLIIGGYTDTAGGHFDYSFGRNGSGLIDDFRLYDRPLTSGQVAQLFGDKNRPASVRSNRIPTLTSGSALLPVTPVFVNGEDGYACYRIPAIVRALNGDLVAFAEGRLAACSDSTPIIHLVCKRSSDNGGSWGPLLTVARNFIAGSEHACMNPTPVVDQVHGTGRIILVFNKMEHSEWEIVSGKGMFRVFCLFSDDLGMSWYGEKDITLQVHKPYNPGYIHIYAHAAQSDNASFDWRKHAVQPGHGIQLLRSSETRGRLVCMGSYTSGEDSVFDSRNYAFYSDDLGRSWQIGGIIGRREDGSEAKGLNEGMLVELQNGEVLANSRHYRAGNAVGQRAMAVASTGQDGSINFGPVYADSTLVESGVQASMIRFTWPDVSEHGSRSRILFSNPNHRRARLNMSMRLSYDEGRSWPVCKTIDPGPSSYSDLVIQQDMGIGLLYERGNQGGIGYASFDIDWLTDHSDTFLSTD
ncbi:MAG: hypothetical protein GY759_10630 [Chloroflexi bacterium]|nr:hypothetical protein [Chloroflexota bacterium]